MIQNIGKIDRLARVVAGLALLSMPMFVTSNWKWLGLIGLVSCSTRSSDGVRPMARWASIPAQPKNRR